MIVIGDRDIPSVKFVAITSNDKLDSLDWLDRMKQGEVVLFFCAARVYTDLIDEVKKRDIPFAFGAIETLTEFIFCQAIGASYIIISGKNEIDELKLAKDCQSIIDNEKLNVKLLAAVGEVFPDKGKYDTTFEFGHNVRLERLARIGIGGVVETTYLDSLLGNL